jgi:hypothetical protein
LKNDSCANNTINSVPASKETFPVSSTITNRLTLHSEIVAVYSESIWHTQTQYVAQLNLLLLLQEPHAASTGIKMVRDAITQMRD